MQPIEKIIRSYIEKSILFSSDGFEFTDETSFLENGIVDSTSVLELVMFIEKQFDISVKDSEVIPENFDSVSSLTMFIKSKIKNN
jgi:acyl carrier protein